MILDGIIRPSGEVFGNFGPAVANLAMQREDLHIFFFRPRLLENQASKLR